MLEKTSYIKILGDAWQLHLAPRVENAPTVISLFAGCGGSSLGYSMAGFRELLAVEWDNNAVDTFRLNFPEVPVYHGDICNLTSDEALKLSGLKPEELDVLDGSPPCQGFSTAGKRKMNDSRNQLFTEFVRLLRGLQPKVFVMENVSGMVKGKMKIIFAEVMRELKSSGYRVSCRVLDAQWFRVPQQRQRTIFIGIRENIDAEPGHPKGSSHRHSVRDAIPEALSIGTNSSFQKKFKPAHGPASTILHSGPESNNNGMIEVGLVAHSGYKKGLRGIDGPLQAIQKSGPSEYISGVIQTPTQRRALTIAELKRICAFPDAFLMTGTYAEQWARLGNSVPPLFMQAIARHIRTEILEKADKARAA